MRKSDEKVDYKNMEKNQKEKRRRRRRKIGRKEEEEEEEEEKKRMMMMLTTMKSEDKTRGESGEHSCVDVLQCNQVIRT